MSYYPGLYRKQFSPTITADVSGWATIRAACVVYETQDGAWRMTFNINGAVDSGSRSTITITVGSVTFKNISNFYQLVAGVNTTDLPLINAVAAPNTSTIVCAHTTATTTGYRFSGDVELESRPSFAY